jgi:hypothetical protein
VDREGLDGLRAGYTAADAHRTWGLVQVHRDGILHALKDAKGGSEQLRADQFL